MPTAILQNFGNKKHFEASILATFRFYGIWKSMLKSHFYKYISKPAKYE